MQPAAREKFELGCRQPIWAISAQFLAVCKGNLDENGRFLPKMMLFGAFGLLGQAKPKPPLPRRTSPERLTSSARLFIFRAAARESPA